MKNISCNVTQDLLPLYKDEICSGESRRLVEEHLSTCEECHKLYQALLENTPDILLDEQTSTFSAERRFFQRIESRITARLAIIVSCIFIFLLLFVYCILPMINIISPDHLSAVSIYQLESGDIYLEVKSNKDITSFEIDPEQHMASSRKDTEPYFDTKLTLSSSFFTKRQWRTQTKRFLLSSKETYQNADSTQSIYNCRKISFNGLFGSEKVIWKKGQAVPKAPQAIEDEVAYMRPQGITNFDLP